MSFREGARKKVVVYNKSRGFSETNALKLKSTKSCKDIF
jgi:hypothetical protein